MPRVAVLSTRAPGSAAGLALVREPEQLALFDGGIDMSALRKERAALMRANWSDNTRRAFAADWRDFSA